MPQKENSSSEVAKEVVENEGHHFLAIKTVQDLAGFFDIKLSILSYRNYQIAEDKKYKEFTISKRSGGTRKILAPIDRIKVLHKKISDALYKIYEPLVFSHGFELNRSIKTNARVHSKQRFVLNIDLKNFFPSINFGRVRGLFLAPPFLLHKDVATILAQLCCHKNELPQGAPSSPIISNIICLRLDRQLSKIALENRCYYSRYADDITFSTSLFDFPPSIGKIGSKGFNLHSSIKSTIKKNGFDLNSEKITFRTQAERQIVAGLVVNVFPNPKRKFIRQVRAMLNAWEEYGLEEAEREYYEKYDKKNRNSTRKSPSYRRIVSGKVHFIGYIRRKDNERDALYEKLKDQLKKLEKEEDTIPKYLDNGSILPLIVTEGHTDWKHLEVALQHFKSVGKFKDLNIEFWQYDQNVKFGDSVLKKFCKKASYLPKNRKYICVFDRDSPDIVRDMNDLRSTFKSWGNRTYSFCIPAPSNRSNYSNISIEMYYTDSEVNTIDSETGKRLFFTNQIREVVENNLTNGKKYTKREVLPAPIESDEFSKKIFDYNIDSIRDPDGKGLAHSKTVFASRVHRSHKDFTNLNFNEFEKIFQIIEKITALEDDASPAATPLVQAATSIPTPKPTQRVSLPKHNWNKKKKKD